MHAIRLQCKQQLRNFRIVSAEEAKYRVRRLRNRSIGASLSARCLSASSSESSSASAHALDHAMLYMWGTDTEGSLLKTQERRDETKIDIPAAIEDWRNDFTDEDAQIGDDVSIASITCGPSGTGFLLSDGRCFVSGENKEGQLGVGHKDPVSSPVEVKLPTEKEDTKVKQVALGASFSAFIDTAGDLYTTGSAGSTFSGLGALGHGNGESCSKPKLVESLVEDGCFAEQVQVGESHTTVLTTEGEVLTAGAGSYGRLGNLDTIDQLYFEPVEILTSGVTQIAGGKSFTLALTTEGIVFGWGRNHKGQLGTGLGLAVDMYAMQGVPEPIEGGMLESHTVVKVAAGHSHAACITASGELFHWGMGLHLEPVRVDALGHTKVAHVECGQDYTLAVDVDGVMYSFGKSKTGVLGQGSLTQINQATRMEAFDPEEQKLVLFSAGWKHAACLAENRNIL